LFAAGLPWLAAVMKRRRKKEKTKKAQGKQRTSNSREQAHINSSNLLIKLGDACEQAGG